MIFTEKLKEQAHNNALKDDPFISRKPSKQFWKNNDLNTHKLREFVKELHENKTSCSQPAEEWLLDNGEFIESQMLVIKQELSKGFVNSLPHLSKIGESRILSICNDYLNLTDGQLKKDSFIAYIQSYQEVSVLTLAETWAIPLMMRVSILFKLAEVIDVIKERHQVCTQVEQLLSGIETVNITPEKLQQVLEAAGQEIPLSGPMIVHLVKHLRERADYSPTVGEWLICKLENGQESLDHILSYEYQLQANYQMTTGNLITSLRNLSRWDWREAFEEISIVEQTLRKESTGCYQKMDFSSKETLRKRTEKLSKRLRLPENLIAAQAIELTNLFADNLLEGETDDLPRQAYVSYYLLDPEGIQALRQNLKSCGEPRSLPETRLLRRVTGIYFNMLAVFLIITLVSFATFIGWNRIITPLEWAVIAIVILLPAIEWSTSAVHWSIERIKRPVPLLRYDFSRGIPIEATTMVVIPVIWSTSEEVGELLDRLELHYLANRDKNLHFALLGDFKDSDQEGQKEDAVVIEAAVAGIKHLNRTYPNNSFYFFQRKRLWNSSEKVWMGWERKRGKLVEFVEVLKGVKDTSYYVIEGEESLLNQISYIITLDADTQLPLESAQRMIGTIHLPFNRPRLNNSKTRVVEGYGVFQPRIAMSHEAAMRSRFSGLWSSDPGIDPYAFAVSDPYQDGLGQGIFTGKGIFDVDTFYKVLCQRIPDNRLLSHDLLEGGFLRAGLLSDIELIDDHPARFSAYQKRLHRWVRGDWQLLLWLLPKVKNRQGEIVPVDLSILTRWQIIENLRRSLLPPVLFVILLLAMTALPGNPINWFVLVFLTLFVPVIRQIINLKTVFLQPRSISYTGIQIIVSIITLPFQSALLLDAIVRTLYRLAFSKQRLLEWVPAADVERNSIKNRTPSVYGMFGGFALITLFMAAAVMLGNEVILVVATFLSTIWTLTPLVIKWLDQPLRKSDIKFSDAEQEDLRKLSLEIWSFYEDYVTKEDNWIPPDNVQFEPPNGVAHRTSPTNIGLYLTCTLAARDFEFIETSALIERFEQTLDTIEKMEKWNGHLYNWYDTVTLKPLHPIYVSSVDSGNFAVCLITAKEGISEWLQLYEDRTEKNQDKGRGQKESLHSAFSEELTPFIKLAKNSDKKVQERWFSRGERLLARLEKLIQEIDFRPLYNHKAKLFYLGYHVERRKHDEVLYDLMASESRQTSFIAIALGQVSVSHWNALGRTMAKVGKKPLLLSWSGTMFEYLMPWLFMRTYKNTIWDTTYQTVVNRQIEYAKQRGVPFGISESGYYAFDYQMNYQYQAFGVPGLGFKRGLEQDLVVAPYATILALPFAIREGLRALKKIEQLDGRGKYGFFEAIDFTQERLPKEKNQVTIKSYMAHHQGMSMLTLANLLLPKTMHERFHKNKQVRSAELLLQERVPKRVKTIKHTALTRVHKPYLEPGENNLSMREYHSFDTKIPEVCVLSNGKFTTVVTNSGSGFSRYEGLSVSRWLEDPIIDPWGSYVYIHDLSKEKIWSTSYQPCKEEASEQRIQFGLDKATFLRDDGDVQTTMEISVSSEWDAEIRRISLTNLSEERKVLEVTTFVELALANPIADDAHPAFSKLFIRTSFDAETGCLVAGRRPREENDKTLWAAHSLMIDGHTLGSVEYETDRSSFIGRGYTLANPQGLRSRLRGKVGSVADPAFVMKRCITVDPGEQVQLVAVTSVATTREEAIDIVTRFAPMQAVERAFQLSWNRAEIELRSLHLTHREAAGFQILAGHVLYNAPYRKGRQNKIISNQNGQSSLWPYGISGDRPVVLVRIDNHNHLPFVVRLLTGHEYMRRLGLLFDLVVLNESEEGYQQNLQEALQRATEQGVDRFGEGVSGVYVVAASQMPESDKALLLAVARAVFQAGGPSFYAQIRLPKLKDEQPLPELLTPDPTIEKFDTLSIGKEQEGNTQDWLYFNGWGGFSPDGKEYFIQIKKGNYLPQPWINVIANRKFGCLVSELGTGYTWWRNSRECKLTPWSNDPVLDPPTETGYLRDEVSGEVWSLAPSTVHSKSAYKVTHGRGYSSFNHQRNGIKHEMTIYVPLEDPVKIIKLKLNNNTSKQRLISLTYYAEWVLGVQRQTNAPYIVTDWLETAKVLTAKNTYQETFREATAFLGIFSEQDNKLDQKQTLSWTGDRDEFIGRNGSMENPAALKRVRLSGRTGSYYSGCGAIQKQITIEPGEEQVVYVLLGCDQSNEAVISLVKKYRQISACETALNEVSNFWGHHLDQIKVSTPSPETDILLNGWLLYQSLACRLWARSAFYQAGGAYGFRDQLQDSLALLHALPEVMREQIVRHASHQYLEGDVQHWWHEETERGIRTLFSDDLLWLPYCVSRYIEHTDDKIILEEMAPFLESEPLGKGEHERYEPTVQSSETGTVYEHCVRAIDKALGRIGEHGLPLIGVGDWNDGMNLVGAEGRGESVWLGWFICDVLKRFSLLCIEQGEIDKEKHYLQVREKLMVALNEHGWDGQWYRRAFTDSGDWLGSIHNDECRIDAIAQAWSVISDGAPREQALQAMRSFDRELVDRELSVVRLLTPAFDKTEPSPGYIQGYPPGIRENGAQYTHGVIWGIVAWCKLGEGDKALEMFRMLNPITHTRTDHEVRKYTGEPYVMAADVYTAEPHEGHAGWTWYTGASSWMYQAGIEWIIGIRRRGEKLFIDPCIPSEWPGFSVSYRFGDTLYLITVKNQSRNTKGVKQLKVDGIEVSFSGEAYVKLEDNKINHNVEVIL